MRIMIAAGGTGGHVYPAIALAMYLKEHERAEIVFIGARHKMEETEVPNAGFSFIGLDSRGFSGTLTNRVKCLQLVAKNIGEAKKTIRSFCPDLVIGFGGYVSVGVLLAAKQCKIKTMIHEQNSVAGLANKLLGSMADGVVVCFPYAQSFFPAHKTRLLGSPRASQVRTLKKDATILQELSLSPSRPVILIVMGSLGSESVNAKMVEVLQSMNAHSDVQVVYVSGNQHYETMRAQCKGLQPHIHVVPYVDQMRLLLHVSAICCRAGATTIAEITSLGIPSVIVPSPYVTRNHQVLNAAELKKQEAAFVVDEKELTCADIVDKLLRLCHDPILRESMAKRAQILSFPEASQSIVQYMKELTNKSKG